jgi:hypothetical protein
MSVLTGESNGEMRLYEDVGDYTNIKGVFEEILAHYNSKCKPMNLVFFEDALEHLTRICRTARLPQVSDGGAQSINSESILVHVCVNGCG